MVEGSADRSDPTIDNSCDPAMEHKILSKVVALRERLVLWTRRLDESVYLNKIEYFTVLNTIYCHTVQYMFLHSNI